MHEITNLTVQLILQKVTQEEIFEHYFGIKVEIGTQVLAPSVLRKDSNPTCSFYYGRNGKLKFRDFRPNSFWGDCFDAAGHCLNLNPNIKGDFMLILEDIASQFQIYGRARNNNRTYKINTSDIVKVKHRPIIEVYERYFNRYDMNYWRPKGRNVTEDLLKYFKVYPVDKVFVTTDSKPRNLYYTYKISDPCYAYLLGTTDGTPDWRLYYPNRERPRFFTNNTRSQGLRQLIPSKFGLVTKSLKDIISLYTYGITSYAPPGEGIFLDRRSVRYAHQFADYWGTLFDYDNAGIAASRHYRDEYGYTRLFLTDKVWNRKGGYMGAKDFSEFNEMHGVKTTTDLVKSVIEPLLELESEYYRNENGIYQRRED